MTCAAFFTPAQAQTFQFSSVQVEGNDRVEPGTILSYAGIARGQAVSQAGLNDAYQRIVNSGLFETVELSPQGGTLVIRVQEYPTINVIAFEGNRKLKDDKLAELVQSKSRFVFSPRQAEADAQAIATAYRDGGRFNATVTPKIIRRDGNRVDLVFEIAEGKVSEIERLSFVGNRAYSDRRLRQVLETKQAGLLRTLISRDTFIADRVELDKQLLRDFYLSRGFVDFQILGVSSEFARERDGFFLTFNIREGQQFRVGQVSAISEVDEADAEEFRQVIRLRPGVVYSPSIIENNIARMEGLALRKGLNFIRVEPRITRNERARTLDVEFAITKGPRVFVERIDIEGNTTTLDQVVRRQFKTVEGDPFNPREIRESAERIRALGFFGEAAVNARQGSSDDRVIVDVDVEEQATGTLSFGASYGTTSGFGLTLGFTESNFLGRGQYLGLNYNSARANASASMTFVEPAFLDRDLALKFNAYYNTTSPDDYTAYDTRRIAIQPALEFPVSEFGRLELRYKIGEDTIFNVDTGDATATPPTNGSSAILQREAGGLITSSLGYTYSYDTRGSSLNPNGGYLLRFSQEFAGLGGDTKYISASGLALAERKVWDEEVTLRAVFEGGGIAPLSGTSTRLTDRFFLSGKMRGFEPFGLGPRDLGASNQDALGGNMFAIAKFEAEFPLGLPEEYGITGGLFLDVGSVWGLDDVAGTAGTVDDAMRLRSAVGFALLWDTPIGPCVSTSPAR
ncbi:MAG: outer membrane protein assembly factor BamA [Paracoccaceae bacterium]